MVGCSFEPLENLSMEFELIECSKIPTSQVVPEGMREPFSLVFRGPMDPLLAQRIYPLDHAEMGQRDIFLVPIGPDQEGMRYEAVFA